MDKLEQIEQQFNFIYPELYKKLYEDGMLDWGEFGKNWHAIYWEKLKINPPLLLFYDDFEIMDFNHIVEEIEAFKDPDDFRQTKPEFNFVPFAQTGAGDLYVFQFDKTYDKNVPVSLVYHDYETVVMMAKNIQDFIFRGLLEAVVEIDQHTRIAEEDFKLNRSNILRTHKPYLSQTQFDVLAEIYSREIFEYTYKCYGFACPEGSEYSAKGLVSRDELSIILKREINFKYLDKEFVYMG